MADIAEIVRELREDYPAVDVTTVVFSRDFAGVGCCVIPQDRVLAIIGGIEGLVKALEALASAKALAGVRGVVAGWNGENRADGPFEHRHPSQLGATLPKTTCGAVYELDEAMQRARALVQESVGP